MSDGVPCLPPGRKSATPRRDAAADELLPPSAPPEPLKSAPFQWRKTTNSFRTDVRAFKTDVQGFFKHLAKIAAHARARKGDNIAETREERKAATRARKNEQNSRKVDEEEKKDRVRKETRAHADAEMARNEARKGPTVARGGTLRERHLDAAKMEDAQLMRSIEDAKSRKQSGRLGGSVRADLRTRDAPGGDAGGIGSRLRKQLTPTD